MEPEELYVDTFIKPLIKEGHSKYRHTTLSGANQHNYLGNYSKLIDEGLLQLAPQSSRDDRAALQPDENILVTGNLARQYYDGPNSRANAVSFVDMVLQHMTWAALSNDLFHRQGRVRMLWWLPERHKEGIIPQRASRITGLSAGLFMGANISEVVGVNRGSESVSEMEYKRKSADAAEKHESMNISSAQKVQERMTSAGMKVPKARQHLYPDLAITKKMTKPPDDLVSPVKIDYDTVPQLEKAIKHQTARIEAVMQTLQGSTRLKSGSAAHKHFSNLAATLQYPQCRLITASIKNFLPRRKNAEGKQHRIRIDDSPTIAQNRVMIIMDSVLRIINLEAHYKHLEENNTFRDASQRESFKSQILSLDKAFRAEIEENHRVICRHVDQAIMEQLAFFASPEVIPFEKRAYEPLSASLEDFWPKHPLALLDLTPTTRDLSVPEIANSREAIKTAQEIIKYLYLRRGQPLPGVLDMIAPNASKDLLPLVGKISDPRRGGRLNLDAMRVRMLSTEMLEDLVKAWFEWPFRPEAWELALAMGGAPSAGAAGDESLDETVGDEAPDAGEE